MVWSCAGFGAGLKRRRAADRALPEQSSPALSLLAALRLTLLKLLDVMSCSKWRIAAIAWPRLTAAPVVPAIFAAVAELPRHRALLGHDLGHDLETVKRGAQRPPQTAPLPES